MALGFSGSNGGVYKNSNNYKHIDVFINIINICKS